jgi:hypothetical protein
MAIASAFIDRAPTRPELVQLLVDMVARVTTLPRAPSEKRWKRLLINTMTCKLVYNLKIRISKILIAMRELAQGLSILYLKSCSEKIGYAGAVGCENLLYCGTGLRNSQ